MVEEGAVAPAFTLPGITDGTVRTFCLTDALNQGQAVLLLFYPFDFSPVCTNELCAIRDAQWFELAHDLDVWAISGDSVYSHRAFADAYDLNFAMLSDSDGNVADAFDVRYDSWENHANVPQRAVVLIDADGTIRYVWKTDNAFEKPDFFPVKDALDALGDEGSGFGPDDLGLTVEYEGGPGEVQK
jgi:peroxiredoxin